jgi:prevent-host-death family protein
MITVTSSELRRHFHKLWKLARDGETTAVTKYGKPLVALKPLEEAKAKQRRNLR